MKKLLSFALILMVCCSSALLFSGCNTKNGTVTFEKASYGFKITAEQRKNELEYIEAIDVALKDITGIEVKDEDGVTLFKGNGLEARGKGASIQISLRQDGTFTGKFSMYGISGEFTYTVNGTGGNNQTHTGYVDLKNNQTQENGSDGKCDICGNAENGAAGSQHSQTA
ncbi:MAG: hypothetical protein J6Q13_01885 [Clostridia bacterium]|nr:hypothetical protein [Clostridia bacterium]